MVDVVLGALPAGRGFQAHEFGDVADEPGAVHGFGVPDRCTRPQLLDVGENFLGVRLVQVDAVMGGQVLRIEMAMAWPGLGGHRHYMAEAIFQGASRWRKARDFNRSLAGFAIPDESVPPARRRPGPEIHVVGALYRFRTRFPRGLRCGFGFDGALTGNESVGL